MQPATGRRRSAPRFVAAAGKATMRLSDRIGKLFGRTSAGDTPPTAARGSGEHVSDRAAAGDGGPRPSVDADIDEQSSRQT